MGRNIRPICGEQWLTSRDGGRREQESGWSNTATASCNLVWILPRDRDHDKPHGWGRKPHAACDHGRPTH